MLPNEFKFVIEIWSIACDIIPSNILNSNSKAPLRR